jgi:hypothetical protein
MDVNEWMSYECSDEGTLFRTSVTHLFVHIHQKEKIAVKIASVNGPLKSLMWLQTSRRRVFACILSQSAYGSIPQDSTYFSSGLVHFIQHVHNDGIFLLGSTDIHLYLICIRTRHKLEKSENSVKCMF